MLAVKLTAVIHRNPEIAWQPVRCEYFAQGLAKLGVKVLVTESRRRLQIPDSFPILLGTTFWREIENDGGEYLLVDRCSFGDTNTFVSLVWNGHGRRGDHHVPRDHDASRWEKHGVEIKPWRDPSKHRRIILCGQIESYSPTWPSLDRWYEAMVPHATHFRPHPAGGSWSNQTRLPEANDWTDCDLAITLNSSVGVECVLNGIQIEAWDAGAMAYEVTGRVDRLPWCHWLAWTQWTDDEIREGIPWVYHLSQRL